MNKRIRNIKISEKGQILEILILLFVVFVAVVILVIAFEGVRNLIFIPSQAGGVCNNIEVDWSNQQRHIILEATNNNDFKAKVNFRIALQGNFTRNLYYRPRIEPEETININITRTNAFENVKIYVILEAVDRGGGTYFDCDRRIIIPEEVMTIYHNWPLLTPASKITLDDKPPSGQWKGSSEGERITINLTSCTLDRKCGNITAVYGSTCSGHLTYMGKSKTVYKFDFRLEEGGIVNCAGSGLVELQPLGEDKWLYLFTDPGRQPVKGILTKTR